ncbi:hypothetical protein RXV86_12770 [Alisedimentitalea sp. MJ-SS2]|uniref:hypothetical protein n=1 Tax=Aliisedimentitalea sp. MJ-SS2 TaxID=3049795 RepID=UPI00290ADE43|nr:hypothetical protein [Alisedimentitalea sp. MJ-SS2]MDU8928262.1 hypothetical protein [Alisedimentitalea sp. MJ-SS2]
MLVVKALTRGMVGFYLALSLLVTAGALSRLENPPDALAFLEEARWVPGAARLEVALRDAMSDTPHVATAPPEDANLTGLQKLRLRTYGDSD